MKTNRLFGACKRFICGSFVFSLAFAGIIYAPDFVASAEPISVAEETATGTAGSYSAALQAYEQNDYRDASDDVPFLMKDVTRPDGKPSDTRDGYEEGNGIVLVWDDKCESYTWQAVFPETGLYQIDIRYLSIASQSTASPVRNVLIDGVMPFEEAGGIILPKLWEENGPVKVNTNGDDVRPGKKETLIWNVTSISDVNALYSAPLKFYIEAGVHTLTLEYVDGGVAIESITAVPPRKLITYDELSKTYTGKQNGETVRFEAEDARFRSDAALRRAYDGDPKCYPFTYGHSRLNVIGGGWWSKGAQTITWEFTVPKDGLYKIALRSLQSNGDGLVSYRQIAIDGEIPFAEMEAYPFYYQRGWVTRTLSGPDETPYLFDLKAGETHRLSIKVVMGEMDEYIRDCNEISLYMSEISRNIIRITGSEPDMNFDYQLDQKIPGLIDNLGYLSGRLEELTNGIKELCGTTPSVCYTFDTVKDAVDTMARKPGQIPALLNDFITNQFTVSVQLQTLQSMPLTLDFIQFLDPEEEPAVFKSNVFERLMATGASFIQSFVKDYTNVSVIDENGEVANKENISIWVARGREWCEILRRMIDEEFTPKTGITVKINVLPGGSASSSFSGGINRFLLSIASDVKPDVVLGGDGGMAVELAIRDVMVNLKDFPEYAEVENRFQKEIMVPFGYRGGVYGLPETVDFYVMFYRKDILQEINCDIPQTWQEVFTKTLPILKQNNMEFFYAQGLNPLLFQRGGEFYTPDGKFTALDSKVAYEAFLEWTRIYTVYDFPRSVEFFQNFKIGYIPIGIGTSGNFMTFQVAAPEIYGRWGIAPIPGIYNEVDGQIHREIGGASTAAFMLDSENQSKVSAGWEFLKWWTETGVQLEYGQQLESALGTEARWFSANTEAFSRLPFNREDMQVVQESRKWYKESPIYPGSNIMDRHITNAWSRVLYKNEHPRDALEEAVKGINGDLFDKQRQYGLRPGEKRPE